MWEASDELAAIERGWSMMYNQIRAAGNGHNGIWSTTSALEWAWRRHDVKAWPNDGDLCTKALELSIWTPFEDGCARSMGFKIHPSGRLEESFHIERLRQQGLTIEDYLRREAEDNSLFCKKAIAEITRRKIKWQTSG